MKIKLIKFRDNLIMPIRAHYNDAGIDCFALENFTIEPNKTVLVPLGFGLEIPDGYMATIRPRSSFNVKGIITQIGTIDSGYRGEIKAVFLNPWNDKCYEFKKGDKICQIVIEQVILAEPTLELENNRGTNGFGSTGQ